MVPPPGAGTAPAEPGEARRLSENAFCLLAAVRVHGLSAAAAATVTGETPAARPQGASQAAVARPSPFEDRTPACAS